jgi:hypothetical protein
VETIGFCLRCQQPFEAEGCPVCDADPAAPQEPSDPRAEAAWQELKAQGFPVPPVPWRRLTQYYAWVDWLNQ